MPYAFSFTLRLGASQWSKQTVYLITDHYQNHVLHLHFCTCCSLDNINLVKCIRMQTAGQYLQLVDHTFTCPVRPVSSNNHWPHRASGPNCLMLNLCLLPIASQIQSSKLPGIMDLLRTLLFTARSAQLHYLSGAPSNNEYDSSQYKTHSLQIGAGTAELPISIIQRLG